MALKREPEPLPGDDKFGGDYSDARRVLVVRSDGARKWSAHKWMQKNEPVSDRKSTRLNSSHSGESRMPSSA